MLTKNEYALFLSCVWDVWVGVGCCWDFCFCVLVVLVPFDVLECDLRFLLLFVVDRRVCLLAITLWKVFSRIQYFSISLAHYQQHDPEKNGEWCEMVQPVGVFSATRSCSN